MTEEKSALFKGFNRIKIGTLILSGIAVLLMMMFIGAEVILRNIFSKSISGNYEIIESYFMPIVVFPAIAITYSSGMMPKITMAVDRFSKKTQYFVNLFLIIVEIISMFLVFYFSLLYAVEGAQDAVSFPAGGIMYPLYPVLFLVPIGFGLLIVELLFTLFHAIKTKEFTPPETDLTLD